MVDIYSGGDFAKGWRRLMIGVFLLTRGGRLCIYCHHFSRVERLSCIVHTYKSWGWITVMITYQFVGKEVCIVHTYVHTYIHTCIHRNIICMYMCTYNKIMSLNEYIIPPFAKPQLKKKRLE